MPGAPIVCDSKEEIPRCKRGINETGKLCVHRLLHSAILRKKLKLCAAGTTKRP